MKPFTCSKICSASSSYTFLARASWNKTANATVIRNELKTLKRRNREKAVSNRSVHIDLRFGLGLSARAQDGDSVIAKVPHDFVAGNAVLPAGTYKVSRVNTEGRDTLIVKNNDTGAGAFLIPTVFEDAPGQDAKLSQQSVGDKYFLSKIQTPNGDGVTIALPGSATKLAQMQQKTTSASGSN